MFAVSLLFVVFLLVSSRLVAAQYYGGPGGQISGFVYGTNGVGFDWAQLRATNGNQTFHAFSGMSGFYLMRVPVGVYNVSVYISGLPLYADNMTNVTVTQDSIATVNFHLQQLPTTPVPEFQTDITALVMAAVFAATLAIMKRRSRANLS